MDRLSAETGARLLWLPFELRTSLVSGGAEASQAAPPHPPHVQEYLRRSAAEEGVRLEVPPFLPNTHLALAAGEAGRDAGPPIHRQVHLGIYHAYFGEGRDIGKADVLLEVVSAAGLEPDRVGRAWDEGAYEERLGKVRGFALQMGVSVTPATAVCDRLLLGSRTYEVLRREAERCLRGAEVSAEEEAGEVVGFSKAEIEEGGGHIGSA